MIFIKLFPQRLTLWQNLCASIFLRSHSRRHSREMGKIYGKEMEVNAENINELWVHCGYKCSVPLETSGTLQRTCIRASHLWRKVRKVAHLSTNSCHYWAKTALEALIPIISGLPWGGKPAPTARKQHQSKYHRFWK